MQLTAEMLELVRDGSRPVPLRDRSAYYERVAAELREAPVLSNGIVMESIRAAQSVLLRPPVEI